MKLFANGDIAEGFFKNGSLHGRGRLFREIDYFEGDWLAGKKHGKGKLVLGNKD